MTRPLCLLGPPSGQLPADTDAQIRYLLLGYESLYQVLAPDSRAQLRQTPADVASS